MIGSAKYWTVFLLVCWRGCSFQLGVGGQHSGGSKSKPGLKTEGMALWCMGWSVCLTLAVIECELDHDRVCLFACRFREMKIFLCFEILLLV